MKRTVTALDNIRQDQLVLVDIVTYEAQLAQGRRRRRAAPGSHHRLAKALENIAKGHLGRVEDVSAPARPGLAKAQ